MANELQHHDPDQLASGLSTVVFVLHSTDGQVVNASTGALMALTSGNIPNAAITASDTGHLYYYWASVPASTPAGKYVVTVHAKAGASLALSDGVKGSGQLRWNGTAEIEPLPNANAGAANGLLTYGSGTGQLSVQSGKVVLANDDHGGPLATLQLDGDGGLRASRTDMGTVVTGQLVDVADAVKAKTDNLPSDPADASDVATAIANVNVNVNLRPLQVTSEQNRVVSRDFALVQFSTETITWVVTDAANNPVDLSGKTIRLVLYTSEAGTPTVTLFKRYDSPADLTVSGTGHNSVTRTFAPADTATAQTLRYVLWNQSDGIPMVTGTAKVEKALR